MEPRNARDITDADNEPANGEPADAEPADEEPAGLADITGFIVGRSKARPAALEAPPCALAVPSCTLRAPRPRPAKPRARTLRASPAGPRGRPPARPQLASGVLRRNDTSFPVKATAKLRELYARYLAARADPADPAHGWAEALKYYQFLVRAVMSDPEYGIGADGNARGLLIYHTMGMGKTRLAVAVAIALWDVRQPVVMLARSLQKNFRATVEEVVAVLNPGAAPAALAAMQAEAVARFTFVSMDAYNAADQMSRAGTGAKRVKRGDLAGATGGLDGKVLIVDEAHNFFRAIINSSAENANARRIYDMVMTAHDLRLVFLTGTPAAKDPFELVPCFNMLAGTDLLPAQYEIFYKLYVDRAGHRVRNRERLANRLVGLVSHVTHTRPSEPAASALEPDASPPGGDAAPLGPKEPRDDGWFPEEKPTVVDRVEMGPYQYRQYLLAREKEEAEGRGGEGAAGRAAGVMGAPPLALPGSEKKAMRSYYVKSRSLSTFAAPREWIGTPVDSIPAEAFTDAIAPKLALIARRIDEGVGPDLVYSQFVDASGLKPLGRYLQRLGYTPYVPVLPPKARPAKGGPPAALGEDTLPVNEPRATEPRTTGGDAETPPSKGQYAIISGEVASEARDAIKDAFNAPANAHGAVIKAILVSKTGAEGLDLKFIRRTHQVEPYWDRARDDQVKARASRMGSHDGVPRAEREVQPYLYVATANKEIWGHMLERDREPKTIDELFFDRALDRYETNHAFRELLAEVCLECELFSYGNCRTCIPTGAPLFHDDPDLDARLPDPCEVRRESEVQAAPLTVGGVTYYYIVDPASPLGFAFFAYREDLGGYAPLDPSDPVIATLLAQVQSEPSGSV